MRSDDRFDGYWLEFFYPAEMEDISDVEATAYSTACELAPAPGAGTEFEENFGYRPSLTFDERAAPDVEVAVACNVYDITPQLHRSSTLDSEPR